MCSVWRGVDVAWSDDGVIDKIEGSHIIDAARVVFVLVGEYDGIYAPHACAQHLLSEVGPCVNYNATIIHLDHCRGAQALVALILRATYLATTPY